MTEPSLTDGLGFPDAFAFGQSVQFEPDTCPFLAEPASE